MTQQGALLELAERLRLLINTRLAFVGAREAMNAARPNPIHATPAERALYDERYRADHEAERKHFASALQFAAWATDNRHEIVSSLTETERLREALEKIERAPAWGYPEKWETTPSEVRQIARTALAQSPQGDEG